jgi:hypothetical protein
VSRPNSTSNNKPVIEFVKPSLLCADTNSWSGNFPQKIGDTWYTIQSSSYYGYTYNPNNYTYEYTGETKTTVVGNSLASTTANANDDQLFTVPTGSANNMNNYWAGSNSNTRLRASKDYLYLLDQGSSYSMMGSTGITVSRFSPAEQTSGNLIANLRSIISSSLGLSLTSFSSTSKDNVVDIVARDLESDDLDKVYATIDEDGGYTLRSITNSAYSTISIVKM